jgi:murein DD-endopeptidase MepM/ murein hydrolase activator NlpD/low affinity Fe/Cu permease
LKKWFMPLIVAVTLVATTVIFPFQGHAEMTIQEIDKKIEALKKEQQQAERKAAQVHNEMASIDTGLKELEHDKVKVEEELNFLHQEIEKSSLEAQKLEAQLEQTSLELSQTETELAEAEDRVESRDQLMKSRLRLMYTNGFVSYMDVLLSSTSFTDFLDRYHALTSIVNQDKDILKANEQDRDLTAIKKKEIELKKNEEKLLLAQKQLAMENLQLKEQDREVLIASLNKKEVSLASKKEDLSHEHEAIEEYSEEQERLLMQLTSKRSEILAKKNGAVSYNGGTFGYPLPKSYPITSNFGYRIDPITGAKGAYHKGMDFGAPGGTDILAAGNGKVIVAQWWGGYGNTVVIDHGSGMWTLYAHMKSNSMTVEYGDSVSRGDKIGEVGTTGRSTGNHLHFEVRKNEVAVNPKDYIN